MGIIPLLRSVRSDTLPDPCGPLSTKVLSLSTESANIEVKPVIETEEQCWSTKKRLKLSPAQPQPFDPLAIAVIDRTLSRIINGWSKTGIVGGALLKRSSTKIRSRNLCVLPFRENWIPRKFPAIRYLVHSYGETLTIKSSYAVSKSSQVFRDLCKQHFSTSTSTQNLHPCPYGETQTINIIICCQQDFTSIQRLLYSVHV